MYRPVEYIGHNDSTNEITIFKLNKFLLRITNSNYNKIEILGNGNFSKNTFYGTIKNKFELKVLMKQLDIV